MNMLKKISSRQEVRYLISGGTAFLTEYITFLIIINISECLIINNIAQTISMILGAVVSFTLNKLWSFKNRKRSLSQIIKYCIVFCFNLLVTNTIIYLITNSNISTNLMIIKLGLVCMTTTWNFFLFKYFVYREKEK